MVRTSAQLNPVLITSHVRPVRATNIDLTIGYIDNGIHTTYISSW